MRCNAAWLARRFNSPGWVGILGLLLSLLGGSPTVNYIPPVADPPRYLPDPDPVQLGLASRGTNLQVNTGGTVDLYPGV